MNSLLRCVLLAGLASASLLNLQAAQDSSSKKFVASVVTAATDGTYQRVKNRDGTYRPEYYALSLGGHAKDTISHPSIDRVQRAEFESLVKNELAKRNYLMAPSADSADLLIHLLWGMTDPRVDDPTMRAAVNSASQALAAFRALLPPGTTAGMGGSFGIPNFAPEQKSAELEAESAMMYMFMMQRIRERALVPTASVLGYIDRANELAGNPAIYAGLETSYSDMWDEIAEQRYYVLVFAYDFKVLQREKKLKPLWVTRVNIRARGNKFDEQITAMMAKAGRYFGRSIDGLARDAQGRVEMGPAEVLGEADESDEQHESGEPASSSPSPERQAGPDAADNPAPSGSSSL